MDEKIIRSVKVCKEGISFSCDIHIEDGWIRKIEKKEGPSELYAIPGFIDTHIHGFGGFGTEDAREESILKMSDALFSHGVTSFFPTIYTDTIECMKSAIRAVRDARGKEKGARIRGIHVEGPFISPERIGAQNAEGRKDPSEKVFMELYNESDGLMKAMTVAPELEGIEKIAELAGKYNVLLLAGHTDATREDIYRGSELGIRHATHLFNAMSPFNHRAVGSAGAILSNDEMTAEIILDGLHVEKSIVKIAIRAKGAENIVGVTDSLKPTEQEKGEKSANGVPVVLKDGLWVTKGKEELIQGSALTMHKAYINLLSWGCSINDAVLMTSTNAARIYSLADTGSLEEGKKADIILLDENNNIIQTERG